MRGWILLGLVVVLFSVIVTPTMAQGTTAVATARAEMRDAQGRVVGEALFEEAADGSVTVSVEVAGFNPVAGAHGIHVHQRGVCTAPAFVSAGEHFNPTGVQHGLENPEGAHVSDLPNMDFYADGSGDYRAVTQAFSLTPGALSVLDEDGSALVIHASPDDYQSDPAGNSGDRISCGVIVGGTTTADTLVTPTPQTAVAPARSANASVTLTNPAQLPFTDDRLSQLKLPAGFQVSVWAKDLGNARMMAFGPDGTLYLTRRAQGDVLALRDTNGDGRADQKRTVARNMPLVHGIVIRERELYLATDTHVYRSTIQADGTITTPSAIISDLPSGGQHPNRTLAFGPDGMLYITVGSTCNDCKDNEGAATIQRAQPDGSERTTFARGLRNTIGFGWHPATGDLWGFDHGSDSRGDDQPPEELNRIQEGGNYGWPYCFANQIVDPYTNAAPTGATRAQYCATTLAPVLTYQAHSAPIGMAFYTASQFPAEYRNDAFVAMRGSWNRSQPVGYKVVRVQFDANGQPTQVDDFMTGFLTQGGQAQFGRVAGVVIAPDGSLLISEDTNGVIYRITYTP